MVGSVWFGNDNDTSMNNMTGGSLPAGTWHEIMAYAHQGIELKPLPGSTIPAGQQAPVTAAAPGVAELGAGQRPASLSRRSVEMLGAIEMAIKNVNGRRSEIPANPVSFAGAAAPPPSTGFQVLKAPAQLH